MIFLLIFVRTIQRESDTGSVVHENESQEEVSDLTQPFVPHSVEHSRLSFLGLSGVNVDFDDETSVLEYFQKFIYEMWQCLLNKQIHMPTNFFVANLNLKQ
jgi:hypothetical protein